MGTLNNQNRKTVKRKKRKNANNYLYIAITLVIVFMVLATTLICLLVGCNEGEASSVSPDSSLISSVEESSEQIVESHIESVTESSEHESSEVIVLNPTEEYEKYIGVEYAIDMPEYYRDMVRPGVLFTGYYSSDDVSRDRIHLKPCVKLKARLGNIMQVNKGEGVGYGFTDYLERDSVIGLLPIGFSDGFTRGFSHRFYVTIRGHKCPLVGNICMDHSMIDITDLPDPQLGEEIVIYGDGINGADGAMNIAEVADMRGTIVDEVLTNLAARLPRKFV